MAATSHECESHPSFLEKQCLGFLQALVTEKIGFKFHISSGDFACSLDFNGADSPTQTRSSTVKVKRKSPSTRKRNADRRRLFLENKKRTGPISVDTEQARSAAASFAKVKARESQPDKVLEAEVKEKEEVAGNKLVPETVDIDTENPESPLDLNPMPIHFQQEISGGSAESLDTSSDPSRDEIVEVTESMQFNRHPRPLQRARARYEARTGNTPWEKRHIGADHHHSNLSQGSQVVQAQDPDPSSSECLPHVPAVERWKHPGETYFVGDEVPADDDRACWACNAVGADVDWHRHEGIAMCRRCVDDYRTTEPGRSLLLQLKIGYEERQNSQ